MFRQGLPSVSDFGAAAEEARRALLGMDRGSGGSGGGGGSGGWGSGGAGTSAGGAGGSGGSSTGGPAMAKRLRNEEVTNPKPQTPSTSTP
jgi:hypothetical protein